MGIYLAKTFQRRADGTKRDYFMLRENYWDFKEKRQRTRYLSYIGPKPVLKESRAKALAKRLGVSVEDLRKVRRLKIVSD
jgi:hypothetical protein